MSQVIVTKDQLGQKRLLTREQEQHIDKTSFLNRWKLSDISKPNPLMKLLGLIFLPVVLAWGVLVVCIGLAFSIFLSILKILGKIFR